METHNLYVVVYAWHVCISYSYHDTLFNTKLLLRVAQKQNLKQTCKKAMIDLSSLKGRLIMMMNMFPAKRESISTVRRF